MAESLVTHQQIGIVTRAPGSRASCNSAFASCGAGGGPGDCPSTTGLNSFLAWFLECRDQLLAFVFEYVFAFGFVGSTLFFAVLLKDPGTQKRKNGVFVPINYRNNGSFKCFGMPKFCGKSAYFFRCVSPRSLGPVLCCAEPQIVCVLLTWGTKQPKLFRFQGRC